MARFFLATIFCSLVHSIAFPKLTFGAQSILLHNQTIAVDQTLVSENNVFEVGFFHPHKSRNLFMGIWYKATPNVVVWVANRNNPIAHSQGVVLALSGNGTLAISRSGSVIWSAIPLAAASRPVVRLLDTGNLVVVDETTEGYLWLSFDYPTDTMLPGMKLADDVDAGVEINLTSWRNSNDPSPGDFVYKIENQGLPELVIYRGGKTKFFRSGKWNGHCFSGIPPFPNVIFKPKLVFKAERMTALLWPYDSSVITRGIMHISGSSKRYTMNARNDKWNHVHSYPRDLCDEYGHCGANGICSIEKAQRCSCFRGYLPKFQSDWDLQDWSGGCTRITELNCQSRDGFVEVRGVKYPDMLRFSLNTSLSLDECKYECLKNCSCTAFANPYIANGGSGCLMWHGDLIDTRELSGAHSKQNIYIRVPVSELDFETHLEGVQKQPVNVILISIASGAIVSSLINGGILLFRRQNKLALKRKNEDIELPLMKMATVLEATNNFSREIGVGGFGPVYMGNLSAGEEIAVKRLSKTSGQGLEEFKNEVVLIAKLQHRNLVRLVGCCIEGEERMLIYEYLPNKSLDYFVFDQNRRALLTWPKRFDIIMGIARGLLYLHHDSRLKIIHRDFKTSNILLDENLNPKISDFGLARIIEEEQSIARTKRIVGTYGYMAPEYALDGKFSVKSDIFSLGVVLLEIISGKKNRGFEHNDHHHSLLGHAWLLWKENKMLELLDDCLGDTFVESQVKRCIHVGLLCVQRFAEDRPIMSSVLFMLGSNGEILPDPKEPGFFFERSWGPVQSCTSPNSDSRSETMTITDLEAR